MVFLFVCADAEFPGFWLACVTLCGFASWRFWWFWDFVAWGCVVVLFFVILACCGGFML